MPNSNYISGRSFEHRVKKYYEDLGFIVIRSAGSKGAYDLVAVHPNGQVILVQCKVVKRARQIKSLFEEVRQSVPLSFDTPYTQILAVRVKGHSEFELMDLT